MIRLPEGGRSPPRRYLIPTIDEHAVHINPPGTEMIFLRRVLALHSLRRLLQRLLHPGGDDRRTSLDARVRENRQASSDVGVAADVPPNG